MSDRRPDRVYGILVHGDRVFIAGSPAGPGLPGGVFRPLAEDRKHELAAHIYDQLGITVRSVWAQGAMEYRAPGEERACFSGFYSVWEFDGEIAGDAGAWLDRDEVMSAPLDPTLKILLTSLLDTRAIRTT